MPTKRVLLAWIGHGDFRALAAESPAPLQHEIMARVKGELPTAGEWGPIGRTVTQTANAANATQKSGNAISMPALQPARGRGSGNV